MKRRAAHTLAGAGKGAPAATHRPCCEFAMAYPSRGMMAEHRLTGMQPDS